MKRVALISIIVSDTAQITKLNEYLHEASEYVNTVSTGSKNGVDRKPVPTRYP